MAPVRPTTVGRVILVLNAGSSSLKYGLIDPSSEAVSDGPRGLVERIGQPGGVPDHRAALAQALAELSLDSRSVQAVGHRVVHGGARFTQPTIIDDELLAAIKELVPLAPLHNPPAIAGIEAARSLL